MTLALVMGYSRGSSGQQAAAFTLSKLRLTERPHPDLMRNLPPPHPMHLGASGKGRTPAQEAFTGQQAQSPLRAGLSPQASDKQCTTKSRESPQLPWGPPQNRVPRAPYAEPRGSFSNPLKQAAGSQPQAARQCGGEREEIGPHCTRGPAAQWEPVSCQQLYVALTVVDTSPGEAHSLGTSSVSCRSWWDLWPGSLCLRVGMCLGVLFISCSVYACVHASRSDPAQASVCASVSACGDTCVPGAGWARLQVHTRGPVCVH